MKLPSTFTAAAFTGLLVGCLLSAEVHAYQRIAQANAANANWTEGLDFSFEARLARAQVILEKAVRARMTERQQYVAAPDDNKFSNTSSKDATATTKEEFETYHMTVFREFMLWKAFEKEALENNREGAKRDLEIAVSNNLYQHRDWKTDYDKLSIIDDDDRTAAWACRQSIEDIKFWLIAVSEGDDYQSDKADYYENIKGCK